MNTLNPKWLLVAPTLLAFLPCAHAACSNNTLHGKYVFNLSGQILAPPVSVGPVNGVALTTFFGDGNLSQVDHVVHSGALPAEEWRPADGTYSINPDCTGWMTISPKPLISTDASPVLKLYIVITEDGRLIRTVVSGSPSAPGFAANISSTGVRLDEPNPHANPRADADSDR